MAWSKVTKAPERGPQGQGFTSRGAFAPNTAYNTYDVVTYQGSVYLAPSAFTSGATFDATKWTLWASKGDAGASGTVGTAQSPLVLDASRNLSFSRTTSLYDATRTYFPGETVTLWDGSLWEATSNVPVNEPPLVHNLLPNPSFETDISNFVLTVASSANDGTFSVSQATDSDSSAKVLQITKTAGTSTATATRTLGSFSMGSVPWQTMTNARLRVKSSVALRFTLSQIAYDATRLTNSSVIGSSPALSPNVWTDVRYTASSYGFSANQESHSFVRHLTIGTGLVTLDTPYTLQIDTAIAAESYRADGPPQFYSAGFPVPLSATQAASWQGAAELSRTTVASGLWRFVSPGRGRAGAFPVQMSPVQGDIVFEAESGSRAIGVF